MDVFLIPVRPATASGEKRFELYCESASAASTSDAPDADDAARPSLWSRWAQRFREALAEGEAEQHRMEAGSSDPASQEGAQTGSAGDSRVGRLLRRKLAEAVAEHRLLWSLRHADAARLFHPELMPSDRAVAWAVDEFRRDFGKHRFWCVVGALVVVASAPLAVIPGPNVLAYYFIFRSVGHYFSLRGAQRGMHVTMWTGVPSRALNDLEAALTLTGAEREARVDAIAAALGLERLAAFVRRVVPAS